MIKNDLQFKIYFYNWIALINSGLFDFPADPVYYEKWLKDYLMSPGFNSFIKDDYGITRKVVFHDLDALYSNYLKYGQI